jgi:protein phosphatase
MMTMMPLPDTLDAGMQTHTGQKRKRNEDSFGSFHSYQGAEEQRAEKGCLYIVADGMGGHDYGDKASAMAVNTIIQSYYQDADSDAAHSLSQAFTDANRAIYDMAQALHRPGGRPMGTTAVGAVFLSDQVIVGNIGDSRAYVLQGGRLSQVTQDHSWVAEHMRLHGLSYEAALRKAEEEGTLNALVRVLGVQADAQADMMVWPWQVGDTLLLCSDGLYGMVDDSTIAAVVRTYPPQEAADRLIELANAAGGHDNITVLIVRHRDSPAQQKRLPYIPLSLRWIVLLVVLMAVVFAFFNGWSRFLWAGNVQEMPRPSHADGTDTEDVLPHSQDTTPTSDPTATLRPPSTALPDIIDTDPSLSGWDKPATTTPTPTPIPPTPVPPTPLPPTLAPLLPTPVPAPPTLAPLLPTPVPAPPASPTPLLRSTPTQAIDDPLPPQPEDP